jgi:spermidine synthase
VEFYFSRMIDENWGGVMGGYFDGYKCIINEEFKGFSYIIELSSEVYSKVSKYQKIEIVDTVPFGKVLITDGIVMISELDETIYHEMMVHVPGSIVPNPEKALVIGGGDGGVVRELSKYSTLKKIRLVEIDPEIVEATQKYMSTWEGVNFDILEIVFEDGFKFVLEDNDVYDMILADISAPIDIAKDIYSEEFFRNVYRLLSDNGTFVIQSESVFLTPKVSKFILNILKNIFPFSGIYYVVIPSYISPWSFVIGSKHTDPRYPRYTNMSSEHYENLKFYTKEVHTASFALPNAVAKYIQQEEEIKFENLLDKSGLDLFLKRYK